MTNIFCPYRREDTGDVIMQVVGRLKQYFGENGVYLDVQDEPLGSAFENRILKSIASTRVVLVFIGAHWAYRLHEASDLVRREVEMALTFDIPVVPVLIGVPDFGRVDLPRHLVELKGRNWMKLDPAMDFETSLSRLIRHIESVLYEMSVTICPIEQEVPGPWGTEQNDPVYFYHLSVENLSKRELKDVMVQVAKTQLSDDGQNYNGSIRRVERPLFWEYGSGDRTKADLKPGESRYCNFVRLKKHDRKLVLDIAGEWPVHEPHVLVRGRMRVELDARSSEGRSRPLQLEVDYDGGWSDRGEDMVKEGHIKITATSNYALQ